MANPLKKTMAYLGLVEDELEYDEEPVAPAHPAPVAPVQQHHPAPAKAPVTPLRKPTPARNATVQEMNEILTVHPRQYSDAKMIAESFREGIPVILNLSQMSESEAQRMIDFSSGLTQGLRGKIEKVTSKVFLLSPEHVMVSGGASAVGNDVEASFFAGA
ncbi:cell division protein SepF [Rathayibacter sp. CAU 1779]